MTIEYKIHLPRPHVKQLEFINSPAKRRIIRAGRRGGKTVGMAILAVQEFLKGRRILYGTPTSDQLDRFWNSVTSALTEPIAAGIFKKNETDHTVELVGTEQRIRGKTCWNHDTLRGDTCDLLILDEFQLMNEDAWQLVGAPMLLDNNGDAVFIYTPPSLHSRSVSKADDPQHAARMFKQAKENTTGRWATFNFTSHDNPHISSQALAEITQDMTALAYRMEIMAQDVDEAPGALWNREIIEKGRTLQSHDYSRVVIGVDPSATSTGDEAGIITAGIVDNDIYIVADSSIQGSPRTWASEAVAAYHRYKADAIIAESNNGGEMVQEVIWTVDPKVNVRLVHASRGKQTRAEPIAAIYEHGKAHHVGTFPLLEDEMCLWIPGDASPNRMDALVWAATELARIGEGVEAVVNPFYD